MSKPKDSDPSEYTAKQQSDIHTVPPGQSGEYMTTNQGVRINDNHNSLKAGARGPSLLEDFVLREKITHFDHERIPERIVHARGAGAFGYFECTEDLSEFTNAGFLTKIGKKTPVLARFSTVAGSRGSMDTARDVRGFAVKFYTDEGNYDFVGNNIPVFFIQDAMKFPDLIHSVKPEPHNEIPQAASAHETFWDFISLMPESTHMAFWVMSDRALPRSLRMMEGFGVHTFRFVNEAGVGTFVKLHWKPRLGTHGITWEEAMTLGGQDPDFHRKDLWENINSGSFPEWDFGVQLIPEKDEWKYPFDLLDPTKLVPEELVPVRRVGKMVLNRNPDNYFAEIEQAAFHPGNLVPGIDVTNDPLLQGRLFSYIDTQLIRLGGPNFHELPVNRPLAPVHNNQRDGLGRQQISTGKVAYEPNSLGRGCPFLAGMKAKPYIHYTEKIEAHKIRTRSSSFGDHFSQAKLFFDSLDPVEQDHIKSAFSFELSKVDTPAIRERMVGTLSHVNTKLAQAVADAVGVKVPANYEVPPSPANPHKNVVPENRSMDIAREEDEPIESKIKLPHESRALSMIKTATPSLQTRKIAILVAASVNANDLEVVQDLLKKEGASSELVAAKLTAIPSSKGKVQPDKTFDNATAFHYDSVIVLDGTDAHDRLKENGKALRFILQAFKQCKTIAGIGMGAEACHTALDALARSQDSDAGLVFDEQAARAMKSFIKAASVHRHWARENSVKNIFV